MVRDTQTGDEIVTRLWEAGVPVANVMQPHRQTELAQLAHRNFFEDVEHPVNGTDSAQHPADAVLRPDRTGSIDGTRRCSASTTARCWLSWVWPTPKSTSWKRRV